MATKKAKKSTKTTTKPTAAQLHEQARLLRRAEGAPEDVQALLERARELERAAR